MKKLFIIGNGFDIAHGLKTKFDDFISSSPEYAERYSIFKNKDNYWCSVEEQFKNIILDKLDEFGTEVNVDEIVEDIIDTYGLDLHGEVGYYNYKSDAFEKEIEEISKIVLLLMRFEKDFWGYLLEEYSDSNILRYFCPKEHLKKCFDSASKVINFNYTNVVELLYGFKEVEHIHGNINDQIVVGCDYFERLDTTAILGEYPTGKTVGRPKEVLAERQKYYEYNMENKLVERKTIKRFFDNVESETQSKEEELYKWLKLRSKELLDFRKTVIENLSKDEFEEVHIIGHSLGKADWSVFDAIRAKKIICYYHDETDLEQKRKCIEENGWNIILEPDTEIFVKK